MARRTRWVRSSLELLGALLLGALAFVTAALVGQTAPAGPGDGVSPGPPAMRALDVRVASPAPQGGVVPATLFGMYGGYQDAAESARVRQGGAQLMRVYVEWAGLQPYQAYGDGQYFELTNKARLDEQLKRVADAGMTAVVLVGEAPDWAAPRPRGPLYPDRSAYFDRFIEILVNTYKNPPYNVRHWELWPEPDAMDQIPEAVLGRYGSDILKRRAWGNHGAAYAAMLRSAYPAIKRIDAGATVLLGAIAYDWFGDNCPGFNCGGIFNYRFIDDVIAAGGACCFDVLAFNDYAVFAPGWEAHAPGRDIVAKTNYLRERLGRTGVDKPLMVLEAGLWSEGSDMPLRLTNGQVIAVRPSAELQAMYVTKLYARAASLGQVGVSWYTFRDFGYDPEKRGLMTEDLRPKPAFWAYRIAADRLRGAFFSGIAPRLPVLSGLGELEGYEFATPDARRFVVAWVDGAETASMTMPFDVQPHIRTVLVYDSLGRVQRVLRPAAGRVDVEVTTSPAYIEELSGTDFRLSLPVAAKLAPGR
ncbi:MAG: cellulase family glycosylhydrolase [Chloroflexi bacterium]|nr:cellulase family glycosylhydrolase [Chloroflexota bacterium]